MDLRHERSRLTQGADDAWRYALDPDLVHPDLADGETLRLTSVSADRADITGAGGKALVTERPVLRFGIDKAQVSAASAVPAARRLAREVGVDVASYAARVEQAAPQGVRRGDRAPRRRGAAGAAGSR